MIHHLSRGQKQPGFTIVELLIVIVVIGILAAITIVAFNGVQDKAKFAQKRSDVAALQKYVEMYKAENGTYPSTSGNWQFQRVQGDAFIPGLVPKYAAKLPMITDGPTPAANTNNTYAYRSNGTDYKIIRFNATAEGGISDSEWAQVPNSMKDDSFYLNNIRDRWGVWSGPTPGTGYNY